MPTPQQQLELKDIHLPDSVSLWPPAIGYWIILIFIAVCIIGYLSIKAYRRRHRIKTLALAEFKRIEKEYALHADAKKLASSVSELLRRAAISSYPRTDCAALTGKDWLRWLDQHISNAKYSFADGPGYLLTEFIYSKATNTDDINSLLILSRHWLKQLPPAQRAQKQTSKARTA